MNALALGAMSTAFQFGWLLVSLVALVLLIRLYLNTRMSGFLWLLVAVVAMPMLSRLVAVFMPYLIASRHEDIATAAAFNIILLGSASVLEAVLLLVAVALLDRQFAARTPVVPFAAAGLPPY